MKYFLLLTTLTLFSASTIPSAEAGRFGERDKTEKDGREADNMY